MKFYGNGVVWDVLANKRLMKFINGEFETTDNYIIDRLISLKYANDGNYPVVEKIIPTLDFETIEEEQFELNVLEKETSKEGEIVEPTKSDGNIRKSKRK